MDTEIATSDIEVDDPELPRFDDFLKQTQEKRVKKEKNSEQLAEARAAKAQKRKAEAEEEVIEDDDEDLKPPKAKEKGIDPDDDVEDDDKLPQPNDELAEVIAKNKAKKKDAEEITLKGKTKEKETEEVAAAEVEAEEEEPEEDKRKNDKAFAALSRRERELVEKEKAFSERERTFVEKERSLQSELEQVKSKFDAKLKEVEDYDKKVRAGIEQARRGGPNQLLKAFGWTVADAVEEAGADQTPHGVALKGLKYEVNQELEALRTQLAQEREERTRLIKEREDRDAEYTVQQYRNNAIGFVRQRGDEYELINKHGAPAEERLWATIVNHFQKHQVFPEVKDAADAVERALEEEAMSLLQAKKVASKFKPQTAPASEAQVTNKQAPAGARAKAPSITLTDSLAVAASAEDDDDLMLGLDRDEALNRLLKKKGRAK
jgi:hypothetical protein